MDVHGALFEVGIGAPDVVQQLAAAVGPPGVAHEELQHAVFGGAHADFPAVVQHASGNGVQGKLALLDLARLVGGAAAPDDGADPRHQFTR
jgi:hypothetical protein